MFGTFGERVCDSEVKWYLGSYFNTLLMTSLQIQLLVEIIILIFD